MAVRKRYLVKVYENNCGFYEHDFEFSLHSRDIYKILSWLSANGYRSSIPRYARIDVCYKQGAVISSHNVVNAKVLESYFRSSFDL